MNEYDSELIRSILLKANYSFVKSEVDADIIMLNTCAIRENAHRKIYGRIYDIRNDRRKRLQLPKNDSRLDESGGPLIGILGCMATNLRKELFENRKLKIDFIAGPDSYKRLPDLIREASETGEKPFDLTLSEFETYSDVYPTHEVGNGLKPFRTNAWIAVMRGCNNFCTFCVVPYTRGRERSRSPENVVEEVQRLANEGVKQITLLGQNVNSYYYDPEPVIARSHAEGGTTKQSNPNQIASFPTVARNDTIQDFAYLIERVSEVDGIKRIRFTSPHPKDFPDRLLNVIAGNPKACKHVHLPLQAGNNRILDAMNRTYTQEEFVALADKIRELIPGVSLTTDIIVGFPTETDDEFADTLKVIERVRFDSAYIFKYSQRQGTAAARQFKDDVSDEVKTERITYINEIQKIISNENNKPLIGTIQEILAEEGRPTKYPNGFQGRTDTNKIVFVPSGDCAAGEFVRVKITDVSTNTLKGEIV